MRVLTVAEACQIAATLAGTNGVPNNNDAETYMAEVARLEAAAMASNQRDAVVKLPPGEPDPRD